MRKRQEEETEKGEGLEGVSWCCVECLVRTINPSINSAVSEETSLLEPILPDSFVNATAMLVHQPNRATILHRPLRQHRRHCSRR